MNTTDLPVRLRLMTEQDLPMLHDWLNRPHIVEWWGGERPSLEEVREKYLPRVMVQENVTPYIGMLGEWPFAYAQSYVALGSGGGWWEDETDPGVRGIDQSIADAELLGRGLGTRLVRSLVELLFSDPAVTRVQTDPAPQNLRAIRCYEKAGFRREKNIVTPDGAAVYMVQDRPCGDIPSPIDLRQMADAQAWEAGAMAKRPWRVEFFDAMADALRGTSGSILELGSGPGFLADHLLGRLPGVRMVLLDFSPAMHALARRRLARHASRVTQLERSFKDEGWQAGLGRFDAVVTNQAVHELRHKRHAPMLHEQVRGLLAPAGRYLVCDHFAGEGGMGDDRLYMTIDEQRAALDAAGFPHVRQLLCKGGLVLHEATLAPL